MVGDDGGSNSMAIVAIAMVVVRAGGGLLKVDHGVRSDR